MLLELSIPCLNTILLPVVPLPILARGPIFSHIGINSSNNCIVLFFHFSIRLTFLVFCVSCVGVCFPFSMNLHCRH